jgi:hypothetical protein
MRPLEKTLASTLFAFALSGAAYGCSSPEDAPPGAGGTGARSGGGGASSTSGGSSGASGKGGAGGTGGATGGTAGASGSSTGGAGTGGKGGTGGGSGGNANGGSGGAGTGGTGGESGAAASSGSAGSAATGTLPEGDTGIAARHPNDEGIGSDPDVVFFDDFESYTDPDELEDRYDAVYQTQYVSLATDTEHVYAGNQSLEFTLPQQDDELSDSVDKVVSPEEDVLFLRYYSRFHPPYDVVGSSHNGSSISAHYFLNGNATPGVPADGTNKFLANLENWRGEESTESPGLLNVYVYHPAQRDVYGDHFFPNGEVMPNTSLPFDFGPDFVSRDQIIQELDVWYCYELMVKANTPGENDGRIAFWLDGALSGDFQNLRLRDIDTLKIDRFGLNFHIGSNPNGEAKKWYDNVVAARSYIGPMVAP